MGTICTESTALVGWTCTNTIDGDITHLSQWATATQGVGAWIKLQFNGVVYINYTRIMQRFAAPEQFKDIDITYGSKPTLNKVTEI